MLGSLTVVLKNGQRYGAVNGLTPLRKGWGDAGGVNELAQMVLAFECSGVLTTVDIQDVERIELNTWAQSGAGQSANPDIVPTNLSVHYGTQVRSQP